MHVLDATGEGPMLGGPPSPDTLPWGISDCSFVVVSVPVDAGRLTKRLPEGFALRPSSLSKVPAGPQGAIELDAYDCRSGVGFNGSLAGVPYGSYYAAVDPPNALRESGYNAYFVKRDFLVRDAERRERLVAGGLPAHDGSADVSASSMGGPVTASLRLEGAGGFDFVGTVGSLGAQAAPLPFMEHTPLGEGAGLARWHARLHDAQIGQGAGEVELVPGSWVAELVGSTRVPATIIAGVWNLDEADVTFPIAWPAPTA